MQGTQPNVTRVSSSYRSVEQGPQPCKQDSKAHSQASQVELQGTQPKSKALSQGTQSNTVEQQGIQPLEKQRNTLKTESRRGLPYQTAQFAQQRSQNLQDSRTCKGASSSKGCQIKLRHLQTTQQERKTEKQKGFAIPDLSICSTTKPTTSRQQNVRGCKLVKELSK